MSGVPADTLVLLSMWSCPVYVTAATAVFKYTQPLNRFAYIWTTALLNRHTKAVESFKAGCVHTKHPLGYINSTI